jgi:hypothetical protein
MCPTTTLKGRYGALFGRVTGIAGLLAGVFCYLQNPLLKLTLEEFDGDWKPVAYAQIMIALAGLAVLVMCRYRSLPGVADGSASTPKSAVGGSETRTSTASAAAGAIEVHAIEEALSDQ